MLAKPMFTPDDEHGGSKQKVADKLRCSSMGSSASHKSPLSRRHMERIKPYFYERGAGLDSKPLDEDTALYIGLSALMVITAISDGIVTTESGLSQIF